MLVCECVCLSYDFNILDVYSICIFYHIICRHIIFFLQHINSHTRINELSDENTSKSRPGANQHQLPAFVPVTSADTGSSAHRPNRRMKKEREKTLAQKPEAIGDNGGNQTKIPAVQYRLEIFRHFTLQDDCTLRQYSAFFSLR